MNSRNPILGFATFCALLTPLPSHAQGFEFELRKEHDRLAQCYWAKLPTTTNNWLRAIKEWEETPYEDRKVSDVFLSKQWLLKNRLRTICPYTPSDDIDEPITPPSLLLHVRAELIRPDVVGADQVEVNTFQCVSSAVDSDGQRIPVFASWGGFEQTGKFWSYTKTTKAQIRADMATLKSTCGIVQSDGTVTNA